LQKTNLQVNTSFTALDESRKQTVTNQIATTTAIAALQFMLIIVLVLQHGVNYSVVKSKTTH
ncbi:MAG: hypothetical protein ACRCYN_00470, partial [Plesiomonas sp.]